LPLSGDGIFVLLRVTLAAAFIGAAISGLGAPLGICVASAEAARLDRTHRHENAFPSFREDFRKSKLTRTGRKIRAGFSRA